MSGDGCSYKNTQNPGDWMSDRSLAYKGLSFQSDSFSSRVTQRPMYMTLVIDLFQTFLAHVAIHSNKIEDFHYKTKMVDIGKSSDIIFKI